MIRKLAPYTKGYRVYILLGILCSAGEAVLELMLPKAMSNIVDYGIGGNGGAGDRSYILTMGLKMVLMALICLALGVGAAALAAKAGMGFGANVRAAEYAQVQRFSFANIERFSTASLITRLTNDVSSVQMTLMMGMRMLVRAPVMLITALVMALTISLQLSQVFLVVLPLLLLLVAIVIRYVGPFFTALQRSTDDLNLVVQENLNAIRVVKSFVREDREQEKFTQRSETLRQTAERAFSFVVLFVPLVTLIMGGTIMAIMWLGGHYVVGGSMLSGDLIAFFTYASEILMSLMMVAMVMMVLTRSIACGKRIVEVLEEQPEITDDDAVKEITADGIAIRLYSREDFETRPEFMEPEILRTSLGAVVLHMLSVGVARTAKDVTDFGFIDPPDMKAVSDGFNELTELKAVARKHGEVVLTHTGRLLARIPIDVRLGRMVIEAAKSTTPNTLAAVLVVVAFLSLQDPRERPDENREEADRIHNRYADPTSDFLTALNLWDRVFQADGEPSNSALRRICKTEYLSWLRMRQWKDLVAQLREMCQEFKFKLGEPIPVSRPPLEIRQLPLNQQAAHSLCCSWDAQGIHTSMLSGLLSMMGMQVTREPKASDFAGLKGAARARAMKRAQKMAKNDYQGARGTHFALFPASTVAKSTPQWVMSTELVETSRLWARYSAQIDPAWAEPLAGALTRTTYADPHWSGSRGSAVASAKVLLYGLPIVQDRTVQWGRINPLEARDFLIRQGLVEGDIQQRFSYDDFVTRNRDILEDAADDASRTRQVAQTVGDEDLFDFYNAIIPNTVTSVADLAKWWKTKHDEQPDLLDFDPDKVERLAGSDSVSLDDYPDHWHTLGTDGSPIDLRLSYIYDPHDPNDGVTVHVPLKALSRLTPEQFSWNVPGLLDELIVGMIKSLPKTLRVQFVPAPDTARKIRAWIDERYPDLPGSGSQQKPNIAPENEDGMAAWPDLPHVFTQAAISIVGAQIHPEVLTGELWNKLAPYLRMTFAVEQQLPPNRKNQHGRRHARGPVKTLGTGKSLVELQRRFAEQAKASARHMVEKQARNAGDQGKFVEQANLLNKAGATTEARATMLWQGALDTLRLPGERISSRWLGTEALMLASAPYKSTKELTEDLQLAAVKRLLPNIDQLPDDEALADAVLDVREVYEDTVYAVAHDVIAILKRYAEVDKAVSGKADLPLLSVLQSIREHIATLVFPGFIGKTPPEALPSIERYLHADLLRLAKAKNDKNRDVRWAWEADEAKQLADKAVAKAQREPAGPRHETLMKQAETLRWMLEEFYVSLWAQELGTPKPISLQRIKKAIA